MNNSVQVKKNIYTICFTLLCLVDWIIGSGTGRAQKVACNCTGLLIAVIIFSAFQLKDFVKIPYAVWIVAVSIGMFFTVRYAKNDYDVYVWQCITGVLNVGVYGLIGIRYILAFWKEKWRPNMNWKYFLPWLIVLFGMVISRNDNVWPIWFLVMFGFFYMVSFTQEELESLFDAAANGILVGFFILQGAATLFRAYDSVRYMGMYTNSNMNALFYLMVQTAILAKWYKFATIGAKKRWSILAASGSGIMLAYCFLTIGRTAMIIMLFDICILALALGRSEKKQVIPRFVGRMAYVVVVGIASFSVVYASVRYIPAYMFSPLVMGTEAGEDKIQGWTSLNDERYVEKEEILDEGLGRFKQLFPNIRADVVINMIMPAMHVSAAEIESTSDVPGSSPENPVFYEGYSPTSFETRNAIYKGYINRLNLWGHTIEEDTGIWLREYYWAPHAHNFFLQVLFLFGILAGGLFVIFVLSSLFLLAKKALFSQKVDWKIFLSFLFVVSFWGFGMFEIDWRIGQLSFTMFFVCQYLLMHKEEQH